MFELKLDKEPKNCVVVCGFPGFGLVGTITTEFLINHLNSEKIGTFYFDEIPPTVAIQNGKVINPFSIYYNEKYNMVLVHGISPINGMEWKIAKVVEDIANRVSAHRIITIEGVGSPSASQQMNPEPAPEQGVELESNVYHYFNNEDLKSSLDNVPSKVFKEGIIVGITSALLINSSHPIISFFAETHSQLPDSKAAAKIIEVLDKHLGLDVDYHPLLDTAQKFEEQIKGLLEKGKLAEQERDKKTISYFG